MQFAVAFLTAHVASGPRGPAWGSATRTYEPAKREREDTLMMGYAMLILNHGRRPLVRDVRDGNATGLPTRLCPLRGG